MKLRNTFVYLVAFLLTTALFCLPAPDQIKSALDSSPRSHSYSSDESSELALKMNTQEKVELISEANVEFHELGATSQNEETGSTEEKMRESTTNPFKKELQEAENLEFKNIEDHSNVDLNKQVKTARTNQQTTVIKREKAIDDLLEKKVENEDESISSNQNLFDRSSPPLLADQPQSQENQGKPRSFIVNLTHLDFVKPESGNRISESDQLLQKIGSTKNRPDNLQITDSDDTLDQIDEKNDQFDSSTISTFKRRQKEYPTENQASSSPQIVTKDNGQARRPFKQTKNSVVFANEFTKRKNFIEIKNTKRAIANDNRQSLKPPTGFSNGVLDPLQYSENKLRTVAEGMKKEYIAKTQLMLKEVEFKLEEAKRKAEKLRLDSGIPKKIIQPEKRANEVRSKGMLLGIPSSLKPVEGEERSIKMKGHRAIVIILDDVEKLCKRAAQSFGTISLLLFVILI